MVLTELLVSYQKLGGVYTDHDFDAYKYLHRDRLLNQMRSNPDEVTELSLLYNMLVNLHPQDPLGIHFVLSKIAGPEPVVRVNFDVLGRLLLEMAAATQSHA
tara:strand:- start:654 stop:959 length:306 start_codon:yes stop_codon:yes gene_type:complete